VLLRICFTIYLRVCDPCTIELRTNRFD
jgi:hypothetical protein